MVSTEIVIILLYKKPIIVLKLFSEKILIKKLGLTRKIR